MNHPGTAEIRTERLVLRQFRENDLDDVYENYGSDPLVNRWISFAPYADRESAARFLQMHIENYQNDPDFYGWAVTLDDTVIGSIGLFHIDEDSDSMEIGYSIGSRWWSKGYATEAVSAVINYAFEKIEVHRIYATHHIENTASGRVMEKSGMSFEGIMKDAQKNRDGSFSDLKLYAVINDRKG